MSSISNACLSHIIGLSKTECACYTNKPSDADESLSELYLDQLLPLEIAKGLENCAEGDLWDIMSQSRTNGIIKFQADLSALMSQDWMPNFHQYSGKIGDTRSKHDRDINKTYAALMIYCKDVRGGTFTLTKIGTLFSQTGIKNVTIYDNLGTNYGTFALDTFSNSHHDNDITDIEFPMHSDKVTNLIYYIVYPVDANKCKDNYLVCTGCTKSNEFDFCIANPYYNKCHDRRYFWADWLMVGGISFNSLSEIFDRDFIPSAVNYMNGLTIDVELNCDIEVSICNENPKKEHPQLYKSFGLAVLYASGIIMVEKILKSHNLSRATTALREQLAKDANGWATQYNSYIDFIAKNIDVTNSDCLKCKDKIKASTRGIY